MQLVQKTDLLCFLILVAVALVVVYHPSTGTRVTLLYREDPVPPSDAPATAPQGLVFVAQWNALLNTTNLPKCTEREAISSFLELVLNQTDLGQQVERVGNATLQKYKLVDAILRLDQDDKQVLSKQKQAANMLACQLEEIKNGVEYHGFFSNYIEMPYMNTNGRIQLRANLPRLWDMHLQGNCTAAHIRSELFEQHKQRARKLLDQGYERSAVVEMYKLCEDGIFPERSRACKRLAEWVILPREQAGQMIRDSLIDSLLEMV